MLNQESVSKSKLVTKSIRIGVGGTGSCNTCICTGTGSDASVAQGTPALLIPYGKRFGVKLKQTCSEPGENSSATVKPKR